MENKDLRSSRSSPALVPDTNEPERILRHPMESKSFTTARGELSKTDMPAGPSNQPSIVEKKRGTTKFYGSFSAREELQSLVATELRSLYCVELKGAMTQGIEETLSKAIDLGFLAVDTGIKSAFFRFIEMAVTDMEQHGLIDKIIHNSLDRWTQSETFVNKLAEEVCRRPTSTTRVMEITNSNKTKKILAEPGNIVEPKQYVDLSSTASVHDSTLRHEHIRRRLRKSQVLKETHQRKLEKIKKHSPSTSPAPLEADSELSSSESTCLDSDSSEWESKQRSKRR